MYEVFGADNKRKYYSTIPLTNEQMRTLLNSGYTVKIDGKRVSKKDVTG